MSSIVHFSQTMADQMPEIEIDLRLKKFYKHRPLSLGYCRCGTVYIVLDFLLMVS